MVRSNTCKSKPTLRERTLLSSDQARGLEGLFKVLANDTRLRLLHALAKNGEFCVTDLAECLGMKPQAVSNQLQKLSLRQIVAARRDGTQIYYRIVDSCVPSLLHKGLCLAEDSRRRG